MNARTHIRFGVILFFLSGIFFFGCNKDTSVNALDSNAVYDDAAYSISGAVGDESGGAAESFGDLLTVQSLGSINASFSTADGSLAKTSSDSGSYDAGTGWWTVSITKSKSNTRVSSSVTRNYRFRFWKDGTHFQQFYVTNGDTAVTMEFEIVSGNGMFQNPHVTHHLTQLQGAWLATNINNDTVTITLEQNYIRKGVDSVVTYRMTRIFDHTLTLTSANVTTLRFKPSLQTYASWRDNLANALSGTIAGHITATTTVIKGEDDKIKTIDKDFSVTFSNGDGSISLNGKRYTCNLKYGDRP